MLEHIVITRNGDGSYKVVYAHDDGDAGRADYRSLDIDGVLKAVEKELRDDDHGAPDAP